MGGVALKKLVAKRREGAPWARRDELVERVGAHVPGVGLGVGHVLRQRAHARWVRPGEGPPEGRRVGPRSGDTQGCIELRAAPPAQSDLGVRAQEELPRSCAPCARRMRRLLAPKRSRRPCSARAEGLDRSGRPCAPRSRRALRRGPLRSSPPPRRAPRAPHRAVRKTLPGRAAGVGDALRRDRGRVGGGRRRGARRGLRGRRVDGRRGGVGRSWAAGGEEQQEERRSVPHGGRTSGGRRMFLGGGESAHVEPLRSRRALARPRPALRGAARRGVPVLSGRRETVSSRGGVVGGRGGVVTPGIRAASC